MYMGVGGWRGWRGRVVGLTMLSDTGNKVVCTVGRQIATVTLTIPLGEQTLSGTVWDHMPPY